MFWYIFIIICLLLTILGIILAVKTDELSAWNCIGVILAICFGMCLFVLAIVVPIITASDKRSVATFKLQKEYIEHHVPDNEIEDAAITDTKIGLNQWLYNSQYFKEHYGFFSLMPDEVLELEEIE